MYSCLMPSLVFIRDTPCGIKGTCDCYHSKCCSCLSVSLLHINYSFVIDPTSFRIRRAGYPIRHEFTEFVDRYRVLQSGLKMCDVTDFKYTSKVLCNKVLGDTHDWQIGRTKVFLKVRWRCRGILLVFVVLLDTCEWRWSV